MTTTFSSALDRQPEWISSLWTFTQPCRPISTSPTIPTKYVTLNARDDGYIGNAKYLVSQYVIIVRNICNEKSKWEKASIENDFRDLQPLEKLLEGGTKHKYIKCYARNVDISVNLLAISRSGEDGTTRSSFSLCLYVPVLRHHFPKSTGSESNIE